MSMAVDVAPFLHSYTERDEIEPSNGAEAPPTNQRFASLDVFRGLTVALMILVDGAGGAFPSINHSPWFGVTLADFVMPFFLFLVGVSVALAFKKISNKLTATKKVVIRAVNLFVLGVLLQGGYFHARKHLTYGVDVRTIRWLGVLQLVISMSEIWLANNIRVDSLVDFARKYYIQWLFAIGLCTLYMSLLYGLLVPSWDYEVLHKDLSSITLTTQTIRCDVRRSLQPPCNAVGFIDRIILGEHHVYQHPVYRRTKECSANSPDYGPLPPDSPGWCLAPFDPEGILSSLMAAVTCFVGLHFGQILLHFKGQYQRVMLWCISSLSLVVFGFVLEMLGIPFCKPLYTLSYTCSTAGASGFVLSIIFYIRYGSVFDSGFDTRPVGSRFDMVDVNHFRKPTLLFQWMGMNALLIYALAACDLFSVALQGFYWRSPENNLVDGTEALLQVIVHSKNWGTLAFVVIEILFWGLFSGILHMKGIYIKL